MATLERLYISPGHNFFGHHGGPPGDHPTLQVQEVECVAGEGIRGDRFFGYKDDYKGQITFFDMAVWDGLCQALDVHHLDPGVVRRNAFTRGLELNELIGVEFELQGVRFQGDSECSPCYWMDQAFGPGAEEWLKGRGGLRARILSDGVLREDASPVADSHAPGSPAPGSPPE